MKIQCACGAKFAFDITPEMAGNPVRFVCPACGLDSSDRVNHLVRQELDMLGAGPDAAAPQPVPAPQPEAAVEVSSPAEHDARSDVPNVDVPIPCPKHPGQFATERCCVCSKPICPKCMDLFGYVCSPLCRGKAEARGIAVPVYAGKASVREGRLWRRTAWIGGGIGTVAVALLGFWFWYAWIGGQPRVVYSVAFAQPAYSGETAVSGEDQLVFLHGLTLARHDLKQKKPVWSRPLIDDKEFEDAVAKAMRERKAAIDKALGDNPDLDLKMPDPVKLRKRLEKEAAAELHLRVQGQNIWVSSPGKLTRYDWDTGQVAKEIPLQAGAGGLIPCGDELLALETEPGGAAVTHINLNTCEARTEGFGQTAGAVAQARAGRPADKAGLPIGMPGKDGGKVMDPAKVAEQAQHLSYAGSIALPAVLANARNQERLQAEMSGQVERKNAPGEVLLPAEQLTLVPTSEGVVQVSTRLIEAHITTREAMKPEGAKSAIDGNLTLSKTADVSNEMLNQMQRERGGEVVREDESRYAVTLRRTGADSWSGEVIGRPTLYPLKTVNVLTAGKVAIVLDKANKKLWQTTLNFEVPARLNRAEADASSCGQGPCVEYKDSLFIFDQGVLSAFDLATGNARWRLPSIGIAGIFLDERGMMYINATSANLDSLRYSNQIDIRRKDASVVIKLDPRTGKTLWKAEPGGLVNYVSGKFVYSVYSYVIDDDDEGVSGYTTDSIMAHQDTLCIKRLNPSNGHLVWEFCEDKAPCDVRFDQNSIRLVTKKEVQVLRFFSF